MKLGDITRESRETFKGDKTGIPIVGLEHLIPQELTFSTYDVDTDNTFTKMFHKGQILFGRRRAYLKKAAVAEFDGICSGDITVIEAIPGKVDKDLLPFIIQNDALFDYAVSRSAGGLSPRVKWEQLSDYEINLPPLEEQKVLADKLWAAYRLKEGYKKLLCATDEMVKSQFIEMFGDAEKKPFVDVCINKGEYGSNSPADDYDGNIRYVRITDITEEGNLNSLVVSPRKVEEKYMLLRDDLLFARTGNTVGKTYLHRSGRMIFAGYLIRYRLNNKLMLPQFAFAYTHTNQYYDWVEKIKKVGAQPNISAAQYDSMPIPVPSMAKQIEFVSIAKQADKSKFGDFKSQFIEMFSKYPSETPWHKLLTIINGKAYPEEYNNIGTYPICGSAGIMYYGERKLCDANTIILGRKGNINHPIYMESDYWIVDTAFCLDVNKSILLPKYFYYWCCQYDFTKLNKQGVLPSLTRKDLEKIEMSVPPMAEQKKFVSIVEQADKSKSYVRIAFKNLESMLGYCIRQIS